MTSRDAILHDPAAAPHTARIVVREYLNDFEEFAAAVNSGLVDDDYAYHIEGSRTLNAYFGFEEIIGFWLRDDQERAQRRRADGIAPNDYYRELRTLAMRWSGRADEESPRDCDSVCIDIHSGFRKIRVLQLEASPYEGHGKDRLLKWGLF